MNMKPDMTSATNANVAIVVASRDHSADLWAPLFSLLRKHWPDCPYPVYLVSNLLRFDDLGVSTITVGADRSWSDTLADGIAQLTQPYVLLWIDDHFLVNRVDGSAVAGAIDAFEHLRGNYLRLQALPKPDQPLNGHFGVIRRGAVYRTATPGSVWNRLVLADLLRSGENAWAFEDAGSTRSDRYDGFYSTWRTCLHLENLLIKGRLRSTVLQRIEHSWEHLAALKYPVMSPMEEAEFAVRMAGNRALISLPSVMAKKVRHMVFQGRTL